MYGKLEITVPVLFDFLAKACSCNGKKVKKKTSKLAYFP